VNSPDASLPTPSSWFASPKSCARQQAWGVAESVPMHSSPRAAGQMSGASLRRAGNAHHVRLDGLRALAPCFSEDAVEAGALLNDLRERVRLRVKGHRSSRRRETRGASAAVRPRPCRAALAPTYWAAGLAPLLLSPCPCRCGPVSNSCFRGAACTLWRERKVAVFHFGK